MSTVAFYDKDKKELSFRDSQRALSMSIVIRGSNTDQARVGYNRKLGRTGLGANAVKAVGNMLQSRSDEWLSNPLRLLFELKSGRAVSSTRISEALKRGAADLGLDPLPVRNVYTHSGEEAPPPWPPQEPRWRSSADVAGGYRTAGAGMCSKRRGAGAPTPRRGDGRQRGTTSKIQPAYRHPHTTHTRDP